LGQKKVLGKGYDPEEISAYINEYEEIHQRRYLDVEQRIENLSQEIESLKRRLEPLREEETERGELELKMKDALLESYLDASVTFFKAVKDYEIEEAELDERIHKRETELRNARQVTERLCKEIERLTQGYDCVLKEEGSAYE
jgi:chromosome segregation ATPase